jgi:DNA-directed RNA polymerase specialized sigma24 family protein
VAEGLRQSPMRPRRENKRPRAFFLNAVDRQGREIDPEVYLVCEEIAGRAFAQADKILGDPALSTTLLEEAAATVSRTLREKSSAGKPPIRNLPNYLFVAFMRRVRQVKGRQVLVEDSEEIDWEAHSPRTDLGETERKVLVDELLASCDETTRDIVLGWMDDLSWQEIATNIGATSNAAKLRFRRAIKRIQSIIQSRSKFE